MLGRQARRWTKYFIGVRHVLKAPPKIWLLSGTVWSLPKGKSRNFPYRVGILKKLDGRTARDALDTLIASSINQRRGRGAIDVKITNSLPFWTQRSAWWWLYKRGSSLSRSKSPVLGRKSSRIYRSSSPFLNEFLIKSNFHIQN